MTHKVKCAKLLEVITAESPLLFDDINMLRIMKDIRNTIAHEYIEDDLVEIFKEVLQYTEELIHIFHNTLRYIENIQENQ